MHKSKNLAVEGGIRKEAPNFSKSSRVSCKKKMNLMKNDRFYFDRVEQISPPPVIVVERRSTDQPDTPSAVIGKKSILKKSEILIFLVFSFMERIQRFVQQKDHQSKPSRFSL